MREFELEIIEQLQNGLSPFRRTPMNAPYLYSALGFRCGKAELESYKVETNPLTTDILYSWPFPQVITGERYNFLIIRDDVVNHEDKIYHFSNDHATETFVFAVDKLTFGQGTLMEVADFGEYAIMMNGKVAVFWNVGGAWNATLQTATMPLLTTICNFKGQLVGGGVQTTWHDCDEKFYCWSRIGDIVFTPDNYNTAGYRRDPYGGEVLHCRRLGDRVIGYSTEGITGLIPVQDPHPTFGFIEMENVGILNQGAMHAELDMHLYLGEDYQLRRVTSQGIENLGYEFYMKQLAGKDVIITYDKKFKDFYIGNSSKTFLLSDKGLTEIPQHPSAMWRKDGSTYCLPASVDSFEPLIVTQPVDFQYAGQKTVFEMESDIQGSEGVTVGVDYTFDNDSYNNSEFKPLNNQGAGSIIVGGNSFRFKLKADSIDEDMSISYIKARYKMTDLRSIRGIYAPPPRGQ